MVVRRSEAPMPIADQDAGTGSIVLIDGLLRDALYDLVACNRYLWFGQLDVCNVPTAAQADP